MATKPKITLLRDNLLYALDKTILFIKKRPILPVNGMFKFEVISGKDAVGISAYDGETYIQCIAPCQISSAEVFPTFLVNAEDVYALVKTCNEPEIDITFAGRENQNVLFRSIRSEHKFPVTPDDMPIPNSDKHVFTFDIHGSDLHAIADTITNLVDESDANKKVTGMGLAFQYIEEEKAMFVWGGSGERMGGYRIPREKPQGFIPFILTKSVMKNMQQVVRGTESVTVSHNDHICEITGHDVYIKTRMVHDKYPDVYKFLKPLVNQKTVVSFAVSELRTAVDRLMIHTKGEQFTARMEYGDKSARIGIDNVALAQTGNEEVPYSSAEANAAIGIGINLKSFKLVLKQSISEVMTFSVLSFKSPMLITSAKEEKTILFIFSPVTLEEHIQKPVTATA